MKHVAIRLALVTVLCLMGGQRLRGQSSGAARSSGAATDDQASQKEEQLLKRIEQLEARVAELEARDAGSRAAMGPRDASSAKVATSPAETAGAARTTLTSAAATTATPGPPAASRSSDLSALPQGLTLNFDLDGYYGFNFNHPVGRVNLLRAYDVLSDSFTLNQAGLVVERAPDVSAGRRFGVRLDLMFGEATETLQGSAQNEPRPQIYRNIFQAYGTYVIPAGSGVTVDFGKWASTLGPEGNYTKDQINYSRSYLFNFLPFYHFGFRANYDLNSRVSVQYWLANGANQSEDFNGFKSQAFAFVIKAAPSVTWNLNYYFGREQRDLTTDLNPGIPILPTQPGLSTTPVTPTPNGREHIFDTYASWNATRRLLLVGEGDYVVNRVFETSAPAHVSAGAAYLRYQFVPAFALGGRFEYLSDRGGLFSGATQALKEGTVTATYQVAEGFQLRGEFRRDFSNRPFFFTRTPSVLAAAQDTATVGFVWWFGNKQGSW
jgi:Putative beta-barrel porin-2, OmpL-like. bbp2